MIVALNFFAVVFFWGLFSGTLSAFRNVPFFLNEEVKLFRLLSNERFNDGTTLNVFAAVFFWGLFSGTLSAFRNVPFLLNGEVKLFRLLSNDRLTDGVPMDSSLDLADVRTWRTDVFAVDARVRPRSSEYSYQNMNSNVFARIAPTFCHNLSENRKSA